MNKLIGNSVFAFMAFACIVTACSVKEDRSACPCRLVMDFSEVDTVLVSCAHVNMFRAGETVADCEMPPAEYFPLCSFTVPRSELYLNVYSGEDDHLVQGKGLSIPYGEDCPMVYMHSRRIDAVSDVVRETVVMNKNHCVLSIRLEKEDELDYGLCVKGKVNGYGLDGKPASGDFSYMPGKDGEGMYVAVVPRQVDSSLILEVDDGSDVIKSFALGEYIIAGGYDWDAPDLGDISVSIDWALTHVSLTVQGWDWIEEYEIVI